jgi:hypothetical protein
MSRITALFVGIAALTVVSTVAEAADGCGRGWYYNGRRCVPQDEPGYGYRGDYGPPIERGPVLRFDLGGGRRDEARYSPPNPAFKTWTARRISRFRMGCASRTQDQDVRPEALHHLTTRTPAATIPRRKSGKALASSSIAEAPRPADLELWERRAGRRK